jgi:hypothetical protein
MYNYFGIIGYLIVALGMFSDDDRTTKKLVVTACLFNSGYFALQGLFISSSVALLTAIRIWTSLYESAKNAAWLFILITIAIPVYVPSTDYVAMIPSLLGVIAVYWLSGIAMRSVMLTGTGFWVLNNYLEGAWVGFFGEMFVLVVGLTRLAIMVNRRRQAPKAAESTD